MIAGKRILLIVSGGIAAYKCLELIRRLRQRGASVRCVLTAGGVISLVAGALLLFNSPLYQVSISAIISVALISGLFFAFAIAKVVRAQKKQATTGKEGLIGELAQTRSTLDPEGTVFVKGELWKAIASNGPVEAGETVQIVAVDGFCLRVKKAP